MLTPNMLWFKAKGDESGHLNISGYLGKFMIFLLREGVNTASPISTESWKDNKLVHR